MGTGNKIGREFEVWFNKEYPLPSTMERGPIGRDLKEGCGRAYMAGYAQLRTDLAAAEEELFNANIEWAIESNKILDENKRLLDEIEKLPSTVATYNRGYVNGYKNASKPSPNFCQVCGIKFINGMEHSCQ